jgi:hypothetical protein
MFALCCSFCFFVIKEFLCHSVTSWSQKKTLKKLTASSICLRMAEEDVGQFILSIRALFQEIAAS